MAFYDNSVDYDDDNDEPMGVEALKNMKPHNFFNNPFSAFLASLSSIFFWFIYYLAKAMIVAAGVFIIIAFIFPLKSIGFLNRLMDQQKIEDKFKDEL